MVDVMAMGMAMLATVMAAGVVTIMAPKWYWQLGWRWWQRHATPRHATPRHAIACHVLANPALA
eukprot:4113771-Lingulodinium_polyedra.AAC.1